MREFISVKANGVVLDSNHEIVVSFYGPRGGSRSIEGLSLESARDLNRQLETAIAKFDVEAAPMANMLETLDWLARQFRDRGHEDPGEHTETDAKQVEEARDAARDMLAVLGEIASTPKEGEPCPEAPAYQQSWTDEGGRYAIERMHDLIDAARVVIAKVKGQAQ